MFCPNCGNKNSTEQKFCRSCGLGLEKIADSIAEQLPTKANQSLQQQKDRLERLGVGALSVFGLGILSFLFYAGFQKLMVSQGKLLAALIMLAFTIVLGCGLLSVILFAKAKELKEIPAHRTPEDRELKPAESTGKLLEPPAQPAFSVSDRTTELLGVERRQKT